MNPPEVSLLGETMIALRSSSTLSIGGNLVTSIAGAESNVAIALARLGHHAAWVGRVGADAPGDLVLRTLRAEGIDIAGARRDPANTGVIFFEHRLPHVQRVSYARAGSAGSTLSPTDIDVPAGTRIVYFTGVTAALGDEPRAAIQAAIERAHERGALVCLDVNYRERLWAPEQARPVLSALTQDADLVVASPEELVLLEAERSTSAAEDVARGLVSSGVGEVIVKDGGRAAYSVNGDGVVTRPALPIDVVDAVGAGDAFVGGYLSGLLDGLSIGERLNRAHTVGAFVASTRGDWEGLPTREELALLGSETGAVLR